MGTAVHDFYFMLCQGNWWTGTIQTDFLKFPLFYLILMLLIGFLIGKLKVRWYYISGVFLIGCLMTHIWG